jgi:hypothetical protein
MSIEFTNDSNSIGQKFFTKNPIFFSLLDNCIKECLFEFRPYSKVYRRDNYQTAEGTLVRIDHYMQGLNHADWIKAKVRKTVKGWLKVKVHVVDVWIWDGVEERARKLTLIITQKKDKRPKVKYSFSNGGANEFHPKEYAFFQAQRYWVERTFDDCRNELGMSDYQIRKWIGWHHHQTLVMLASLFLLKEKIKNSSLHPLMSVRDARMLIIVQMFGTQEQYYKRLKQMKIRRQKRQIDIDRHYLSEERWE